MAEIDYKDPKGDSREVFIGDQRIGYATLTRDDVQLQTCGHCQKENHRAAISSGFCYWCGWDANIARGADRCRHSDLK